VVGSTDAPAVGIRIIKSLAPPRRSSLQVQNAAGATVVSAGLTAVIVVAPRRMNLQITSRTLFSSGTPPEGRRTGLSLLLRAEGQLVTKARLIRAAGLRWPIEENFEFGCDITAAQLKERTDTQALPPTRPDQARPETPGRSH
jgi:hypothetical protein